MTSWFRDVTLRRTSAKPSARCAAPWCRPARVRAARAPAAGRSARCSEERGGAGTAGLGGVEAFLDAVSLRVAVAEGPRAVHHHQPVVVR
jgi:hypothetical protein